MKIHELVVKGCAFEWWVNQEVVFIRTPDEVITSISADGLRCSYKGRISKFLGREIASYLAFERFWESLC